MHLQHRICNLDVKQIYPLLNPHVLCRGRSVIIMHMAVMYMHSCYMPVRRFTLIMQDSTSGIILLIQNMFY